MDTRNTTSITAIQDYTRDLQELADLAITPEATLETYARALDALAELIDYDLAAILELDGRTLHVRAARGPLASEHVHGHKLSLDRFPTLERALELRRPTAITEDQHSGAEGDPYDGVLDLPHGHSCMVVPLFAGNESLGIITLDRRECVAYAPEAVALAGVYGRVVSLSLALARKTKLLERFRGQLTEQNRLLRHEHGGDEVACARLEASQSTVMRALVQKARQVAVTDAQVLIEGETGTGKEVLAQAVHAWSRRADAPFVKLNCAALPESLVESELFGHVKGAFSGAHRTRAGRFLTANGGTLLLDEIGDMPLSTQSKLLRVLQEGTFEPVGSDRTCKVDVRVIAATHRDLTKEVQSGKFREDLYFRLAVFPLHVPALRDRPDDILPIARQTLEELHQRYRGGPWKLAEDAAQELLSQPFLGNVRELVNAVERATILEPSGTLRASHFSLSSGATRRARAPRRSPGGILPRHSENEARYFEQVLTATRGKVHGPGGAAEISGLKPTTLLSKLKKLGISPSGYR